MARKTPSPHDTLIKRGFSVPEHAAAELKAVLPTELSSHFAWNRLKLESGSFVDKALEQSHSDLLYSVPINDETAFVYLLFEHQSKNDPLLPLRLLRYVLRILERWVTEHRKQPLPLPPVIAVVLHHSDNGWRCAADLLTLFGELPNRIPTLRAYLPQLTFLLDDISKLSDTELRQRQLGAIPTLLLAVLRDSRNGDKVLRTLVDFVQCLRVLPNNPLGQDAIQTIYCYISSVTDVSPETLNQTFIDLEPATESHIMTAAQILERRGFDKGKLEGKLEGEAGVLERLLRRKFGDLPTSIQARLSTATPEQLELWTDRILFADSLETVFSKK